VTKEVSGKKKISKALFSVLLAFMAILFTLLVGSRLIGYKPYSVMSGSMEPTYHVGSLLYVQTVSPESIKVGDTITFENSDNSIIITHRVVRIDNEKQCFYTKGDANNAEDQMPVSFSKLIGHPVMNIPFLGYVAVFISTPLGKTISIALIVLILAGLYVPDLINKLTKNDKEEKHT